MVYAGCYTDSSSSNSFAYKAYTDTATNTIEKCTNTCNGSGYKIAGLEFGQECYCGNVIAASAQKTTDEGCNDVCTGNSSQICGDQNRLSIYSNRPPSILTPPTAPLIIGSYAYQGCYRDNNPDRSLTDKSTTSSTLTLESCASFCSGYSYFGTEYASECYCGNSLDSGATLQPASDCTQTCSGNSTQLCGAGDRLTLYYSDSPIVSTTSSARRSSAPYSSSAAASPTSSSLVCPDSNGALYTAASGSIYQVECSNDHAGGDLSLLYTTSLTACIDACDSTATCQSWSYVATVNGVSNPCYLKSDVGADQANSGVMGGKLVSTAVGLGITSPSSSSNSITISTSSSSSAPTSTGLGCPASDGATYTGASGKTYRVECFVDHVGGDILMQYVDSLTACIITCDLTTDCVAWSYAPNPDTSTSPCYMKNLVGDGISNPNVMGGELVTISISNSSATTSSGGYAIAIQTPAESSSQISSPPAPAATYPPSSVPVCPDNDGQFITVKSGKGYQVECYNDHTGGDLSMDYVTSLMDCIKLCDLTTGCEAFSWISAEDGSEQPCYMKDSVGADQRNMGVWGGKFVNEASMVTASSTSSSLIPVSSPVSSSSSFQQINSPTSTNSSTVFLYSPTSSLSLPIAPLSSSSNFSSTTAPQPIESSTSTSSYISEATSVTSTSTSFSSMAGAVSSISTSTASSTSTALSATVIYTSPSNSSSSFSQASSTNTSQNSTTLVMLTSSLMSPVPSSTTTSSVSTTTFSAVATLYSPTATTLASASPTSALSSSSQMQEPTTLITSTLPATSASTLMSEAPSALDSSSSSIAATPSSSLPSLSSSSSPPSANVHDASTSSSGAASLPSGVSSLGCYADSADTRTLNTQLYSNSQNTPSNCALGCRNAGYKYSGVEYGSECWCSNTSPTANTLSSSSCSQQCSGDSTQTCGDSAKINIYIDATYKQTIYARQSYGSWSLISCYMDSSASRTMSDVNTDSEESMTETTCLDACTADGMGYCGVEYYAECYGSTTKPSDSLAIAGDALTAGCNYACKGNSTEACGGANRILVYVDESRL